MTWFLLSPSRADCWCQLPAKSNNERWRHLQINLRMPPLSGSGKGASVIWRSLIEQVNLAFPTARPTFSSLLSSPLFVCHLPASERLIEEEVNSSLGHSSS